LLLLCALTLVTLSEPALPASTAGIGGLSIDPSKTSVGIVRVHLEISDLWISGDDELEGSFRIKVPLLPSRNDSGAIRLQADRPLEQMRQSGGLLTGSARSGVSGETHAVACRVQADGQLDINVTTSKRSLSFKSRYRTTNEPSAPQPRSRGYSLDHSAQSPAAGTRSVSLHP
jgi:hypothetical protein